MGSHYDGTPEEVRALDTWIKLVRASESVSAVIKRHLIRAELTMSQLGVLESLLHLGPLCQTDLGEKLLKSSGNVTTVVDNLERRGLVCRKRDRTDRRYVTVHLTDEGRALIEDYFPDHVRAIVEVMATLEPEDQERLGALCRALGRGAAGD